MYRFLLLAALLAVKGARAQSVEGRVLSIEDSSAIAGVLIIVDNEITVPTDKDGRFTFIAPQQRGTITFSHLGFMEQKVSYPLESREIFLHPRQQELDEVVVSTGYYEIPVGKLTGSFSHVNNQELNLHNSPNILERLENVSTGIQFDRRNTTVANDRLDIRVRGLSTIYSDKSPLIVLDNFPYYGDINSINPNDIEDITILKDAAAASIWGAKAGNGVVVIKSKRGKKGDKPKVSFTSGVQFRGKPDVYTDRSFLPSADFIEVERALFLQSFYEGDEAARAKPILSPVIELLIAERDGLLGAEEVESRIAEYSQWDVRRDLNQHLYQKEVNKQYSVNINGSSDRFTYYLSAGHHSDVSNVQGVSSNRTSILSNTMFKPHERIEISSNLNYVFKQTTYEGIGTGMLKTGGGKENLYPYARFADEDGAHLAVLRGYRSIYVEGAEERGLLDWLYRPLDEKHLSETTNGDTEIRLNNSVKYSFIKGLNFELRYQFQKTLGENRTLDNKDSYYARDIVNRFTQANGSQPIPYGDILRLDKSTLKSHTGRAQLDYQGTIEGKHQLFALGGMEISTITRETDGYGVYGYDDDVLTYTTAIDYNNRYPVHPSGSARIGSLIPPMRSFIDKHLSYYGNFAYSYTDRLFASFSARWEASNLFGVKTNQKGVPLWSAGLGWALTEGKFIDAEWLSYLKLRITYGMNGNINKSATAYTIAKYNNDTFTDMRAAQIVNPGNPSLRWERVKIWNWGVDFSLLDTRFNGKIDYYIKNGVDLLGRIEVNPISGFPSSILTTPFRVNYADVVTKGLDVELRYSTSTRSGFNWRSSLMLSHAKNEVKKYKVDDALGIHSYFRALGSLPPVEGISLDAFYSVPWYGLDPENGHPLVRLDGELTSHPDAYTEFMAGLEREDLIYSGLSVPLLHGSFQNTLSWNNWTLNAMLSFKAGYCFRRNSLDYTALFENWNGHIDYTKRWREPGDEAFTNVPSMPMLTEHSANRDQVYLRSEALVEKGDHVRLHNLNIGYMIHSMGMVERIGISGGVRNLGVIWRANNVGLDPDYPSARYKIPKTFYATLTISF